MKLTSQQKKVSLLVFVIILLLSILRVMLAENDLDNVVGIAALDNGETWVATNEDENITFYHLNKKGKVRDQFSVKRTYKEKTGQITGMCVDENNTLFFLKSYSDLETGKQLAQQELGVYRYSSNPFGRLNFLLLDSPNGDSSSSVRYKDIAASSSVVLHGVSEDETSIVRASYDTDSLMKGNLVLKHTRNYSILASDGYYHGVPSEDKVTYLTRSGKLMVVGENGTPYQIYPRTTNDEEINPYAFILKQGKNGTVNIFQRPDGDWYRIYTENGKEEIIKSGYQNFTNLVYTYKDVVDISFYKDSTDSYTAVAESARTKNFELVVCSTENGNSSIENITQIKRNILSTMWNIVKFTAVYSLIIILVIIGLQKLWSLIIQSRTIFIKLAFASIPPLVLALVLFGAFSYQSYGVHSSSNHISSLKSEGDLLKTFFKAKNFDRISSPEAYLSTDYAYLLSLLNSREMYTSTAYYIDFELYTGVNKDAPCLYPFGIYQNRQLQELHRLAALSGKQQIGTIDDHIGNRIACVTPVGGASGSKVFLIETSVFSDSITREANQLIGKYALVSAFCVVGAMLILLILFSKILAPLRGIVAKLDAYVQGSQGVRLEVATNDELADIGRVFNKMANDSETQQYNLKIFTDIYYKFMPRNMFKMLDRDNLADLKLGTHVFEKRSILFVDLVIKENRRDWQGIRKLANHFFEIIHTVASASDSIVITNSADLRKLQVICDTSNSAVLIAMSSLEQIDSYNATATLQDRLTVSFLLHETEIYFGICGDEERYIPAIISQQLAEVEESVEVFRSISSRLLVTESAHSDLDPDKYNRRYIGKVNIANKPEGIYDFYDSNVQKIVSHFSATKETFEKALALYERGRYYDAKSLFTVVLRENKYDNLTRHYIFRCEKEI